MKMLWSSVPPIQKCSKYWMFWRTSKCSRLNPLQSPGGPCINSVYKPEQPVSISSPKLVFIEEKHAAEMCRPPAYFKPRTCTHTFGRKSTKTFLHLTLKPQNQHGYWCTTNIETSKYSGQSQWLMLCIFYIQSVVDASAKSKSLSIDFGLAQKRFGSL